LARGPARRHLLSDDPAPLPRRAERPCRHRHHARRGRGGPPAEARLGHLRSGVHRCHPRGQRPRPTRDRAGKPGRADPLARPARARPAAPARQHYRAHGRRGLFPGGQIRHAERPPFGPRPDYRHPARGRLADRHAPVRPRRRRRRPRRLPGGGVLGDAGEAQGRGGLGHPRPAQREDDVMRRIDWSALDAAGRREALARPARRTDPEVAAGVRAIFDDVQARGGAAVADWSRKLDGAPPRRLPITPEAEAAARAALPPAATRALRIAADNVRVFHEATRPADSPWIETTPGVRSHLLWRPLASAGLYVPGGTAPLFSSLLMLAIPAAVAGVGRRVAVTPPPRSGEVHPAMIVAAAEAGLDALWLIGGAQAVAALSFGATFDDGEIEPVDKLFGPGNAWVAEAKTQA